MAVKKRTLTIIALEIREDWGKIGKGISPYATPYLDAMLSLSSINDNYYHDSGTSIVAHFLANAQTWRGEVARRVKKELNEMLKAS